MHSSRVIRMPLLQPRLNLKISQRQILTPGLMQMVSVLALNKLELAAMIQNEIAENPLLEEMDESIPMLEGVEQQEADRELTSQSADTPAADSFEEIDFGSYFQEYLDPGFRSQREFEDMEKPGFEQFLSRPVSLFDHLQWQLGALTLSEVVAQAADFLIGNLDENGYLCSPLEELAEAYAQSVSHNSAEVCAQLAAALQVVQSLDPAGVGARSLSECLQIQIRAQLQELDALYGSSEAPRHATQADQSHDESDTPGAQASHAHSPHHSLHVAAEQELQHRRCIFGIAEVVLQKHFALLAHLDPREIAKAAGCTQPEAVDVLNLIRSLDPRPGARYSNCETQWIEPDVAFIKRDNTWVALMNEENVPSLRLSHRYRRMLLAKSTEKEVRDYVKDRLRSAMQLMRNIAQRKSTILRTCEVIIRRQEDFLEQGIEALRPMMIKEVAEELGVHPSTVSRAVANKYAHTPQGVIELRAFFSEGANGPEGADTPLVVLKRKVRKLIEDEDPSRPFTDDQLAVLLQAQGIQVTRRTVAKYREDLRIPSTHQRRKRR